MDPRAPFVSILVTIRGCLHLRPAVRNPQDHPSHYPPKSNNILSYYAKMKMLLCPLCLLSVCCDLSSVQGPCARVPGRRQKSSRDDNDGTIKNNEHERAYEFDPSSNISAYGMVLLSMVYGGIWTPVHPTVIAYLATCAAKSED